MNVWQVHEVNSIYKILYFLYYLVIGKDKSERTNGDFTAMMKVVLTNHSDFKERFTLI